MLNAQCSRSKEGRDKRENPAIKFQVPTIPVIHWNLFSAVTNRGVIGNFRFSAFVFQFKGHNLGETAKNTDLFLKPQNL